MPKCRWSFPGRCVVICWLQAGHAVSGVHKLENTWPEIPWEGSCWLSLVYTVASWQLWRKLSAFLRLTETQIDSIGKKCWPRPVLGWPPSFYIYQTTHLHFGSWPKCRWSFPGRCVVICWLQAGMQSLVSISLRTPDQRSLEKGRVGSALSTRWLHGISGANYLHFYGWRKRR